MGVLFRLPTDRTDRDRDRKSTNGNTALSPYPPISPLAPAASTRRALTAAATQVKINDPNGPASLLGNLDSVSAPDPTTVVFKLKAPNDQTFAQVLSSPAGPIVDEEVLSPTAVTPDKTIVDGKAFAGQYTITSYDVNNLIQYKAYDAYQGLLGPAKTGTVNVKYYADASNLDCRPRIGYGR